MTVRLLLLRASLSTAIVAVGLVGCRTETSSPPPRMDAPVEAMRTSVAVTRPTSKPSSRPATTQASLAARLESILTRHRETGAIVSARFVDPQSGREIFAYDAGRPVVPASNMKLTVTSAAIDFFGPDAKLETNLYIVGQDLWLVGTGDPAVGDEMIADSHHLKHLQLFDDWAGELKSRGVTSLAGNLYYVDNAFEKQQLHPDWGASDRTEWYAAPVGGLNLNDNCIDTIAVPATQPTTQPGVPVKLAVIPETSASIVIVNNGVTGPTTMTAKTQTIDINRAPDQNMFTVDGEAITTTELSSKPVTDPGAFFADALRTHLAASGITIAGAIVRGDALPSDSTAPPVALKPAVTVFSDVLWRIMKNSQNLFAECTAKYLGRAYAMQAKRDSAAVGSWANAEVAIRAFFAKNNIDDRDYRFHDGSGLSHEDRVTTKLISEVLVTMYHHAYFDAFRNAMTVGGVDGTIKNRFKDMPGRVYAKTGYISGVRSLSGYAKTDSGKWIVFAIIYNKIPGRGGEATKPYEALQDEAIHALVSDPSVQ